MTTSDPTHDDARIAVTGAAGYIGSRVLKILREAHPEWDLVGFDNFYRGNLRQVGDTAIEHVDVRDRNRLETALDGADVVLHLAAVSGVDDCDTHPDLAYEVNVQGTANVAWFCRKTGAGLVFPFSMAVLGDPRDFPITVDHPRDPMNWYGRTKLVGEHIIEDMASGAFPAHLLLKSNLYGEHEVDGESVSKGTVINFFVDRAFSEEELTVYEPGTQSRNFVHVKDIARAYIGCAERLLDQLSAGETGVEKYELAGDEDPSVMEVAETVRDVAIREAGLNPSITLVENPRTAETLVEDFTVDTAAAADRLGWTPRHTVAETVEELIRQYAEERRPAE